MEITRRVLGSSAIVHPIEGGREIALTLDIGNFIRRLLLFDTYVLYSIRLKEIPELIRHFGYQGTMDLLSSGALEIRYECTQFVEGQLNTPPCPPLTFQFHVIDAHIWEQYLIDSLPNVGTGLALSARQLLDLKEAVAKAVKRHDNRKMFAEDVAPAFEGEVLHNPTLVKAAVSFHLSKYRGIRDCGFDLKLEKIGVDRYRADTNLPRKTRLGTDEVHNAVKSALLGISGLTQRIGEMKQFSALSGFTEQELPVFRTKFNSLADALGSEKHEERLQRVLSISGLPDISPDQRIDVERLLEIRNEPEGLEFRAWLADVDTLSDQEIKDRVASLNAKIGLAVQTTAGKAMRFLVTTALGFAVPPVGVALGALDQFLWDNFFRRSGIAAFVNKMYPSIFPDQ